MVGNKFTEDLQTWYDAFAQANKDQGGITKEEMEALRKQYDAIAGSALADVTSLRKFSDGPKRIPTVARITMRISSVVCRVLLLPLM